MTIGIISAMDSEHRQLAERLHEKVEVAEGNLRYVEGNLGGSRVVLTQCGIGKVNAAIGASELIRRYHPDYLLSTGVAGGIDASLQVTDVVVSSCIVYHDVWCGDGNAYGQVQGLPLYYEGCSTLLEQALALNGRAGMESRVQAGLICTGDQFISDKTQLAAIKQRFPDGLAVDMESAAIAQTCHLYGVPFISFRIISDTPGAEEDNFRQYLDFWGTVAERSFHTTWHFLETVAGDTRL
ncbi:MAG: 5'-methylthioadenosine/adenosylhomocysteine nucleosidase [Bacteroides sp.]|nr:5'-methylthioadenosine/adenosylhomocysteine nucleosidase [Bacteroides sp.]